MELQEVLLRAISVQLRFVVRPRFWDNRGRILEEVMSEHDLEDWHLAGQEIQLSRKNRTRSFVVSSRDLRAHHEVVDDREETLEATTRFLQYGVDVLNVESVEFIGVRSYWAGAVDSFDEAKEWLMDRFGGGSLELAALFNKPVSDVGWIFESHAQDPRLTLRFGPMTQDQLLAYQIFSEEVRDRLPLNSVFIDLDRVLQDESVGSAHAVRTFEGSFHKNLELGDALASALAG